MKSPYQFIVTPAGGKRYNNVKSIGGVDFIVNTSEEEHKFSNREAIVVATPIYYDGPIVEGDTLLVHHNVFKFYNDMKGRRKSGKSFLRDDHFLIDPDQFFAYRKGDDWLGYDRYCFVEPVAKEESYIYEPHTYEPLVGKMAIVNDYLYSQGIRKGDRVSFDPKIEYQFNIDGQLLYRIYDSSIRLAL